MGDGGIVPVSPVLEPSNKDERDSREEQQPSDNDQWQGSSVMSITVYSGGIVEPPLGCSPGDDDDKE